MRVEDFLRALAKILAPFLAVEAIITPFRQKIAEWANGIAHAIIPGKYQIVWACTGIDELILLASAIAVTPTGWKTKAAGFLATAVLFEGYNVLRIWITASHPDPFLHDVLFRWGGFILVLLLFWGYVKYYKILKRLVEHGRREGNP